MLEPYGKPTSLQGCSFKKGMLYLSLDTSQSMCQESIKFREVDLFVSTRFLFLSMEVQGLHHFEEAVHLSISDGILGADDGLDGNTLPEKAG